MTTAPTAPASPRIPTGIPVETPADIPARVPVGTPVDTSPAADTESPWSCWWQILPEGTRVSVYRINDRGLLQGAALATVTVADALRLHLDTETSTRTWLSAQAGPGRYRFIPRDAAGQALKDAGIDSVSIDVIGRTAAANAKPATTAIGSPGDAVELRRLELEHSERQADKDREARLEETRLKLEMERLRVESEDRRRREDREAEERRRVEELARQREAEERQRQRDAEDRRHQELVALLRDRQTSPAVDMSAMMKMVSDTQATAAAGMMNMVSTLSQGMLKQAVETAAGAKPQAGSLVSDLAAALPAAAKLVREFRLAKQGAGAVDLDEEDGDEEEEEDDEDQGQPTPPALPAPAPASTPGAPAPAMTADAKRIRAALGILRLVQSGDMPNDAASMRAFVAAAPAEVIAALKAGDEPAIQAAVAPAVDADLFAWLNQPEATTWLMGYLANVQAALLAQDKKRQKQAATTDAKPATDTKPATDPKPAA